MVAAITPFNFPFMLNVVKSAPALAAGCTIVLKPHPWTPLDAFFIAQVAEEAGIPPGVFNVITGHGEVGDELTSNPMVDMVTFTGSTATGRRIMASAAPTLKRVQLELGGKSAQVLLDDVGEDYARSVGFGAVLAHCGQGCVIDTRLLLPENLLDAYKEGVAAAAPSIKIGDPRDPSSVLGPLIREQQRARVEGYVASGVEQGAELFTGGKRPDGFDKGFYFEPTVFIGTNDMRISQEEIFGPVLTVIPYSGNDADAVRIANDSIYGLGGGVVAANTARAFNVARQIRAGLVERAGSRVPARSPIWDQVVARAPAGARAWPVSASPARSAATSRAASAASGVTSVSRSSPRSRTSAGADPPHNELASRERALRVHSTQVGGSGACIYSAAMYLNEFADDLAPLDMTKSDEFSSLLTSAADLGIPHSRDVRYVSRHTVVRSLRFHFEEWGEPGAPQIVLLHGGNQSAHSWDLVSLHLSDRYHVFALDQRGHGDSEWPRDQDSSIDARVQARSRSSTTRGSRTR